jgi:antirestriction protein ArdC
MTKRADKAKAKTDAAMKAAADMIIAAIEEGIADPDSWTPPWVKMAGATSFNPVTDRAYTGANWLLLAISSAYLGAESHWATYKQWATKEAQVRKGEAGTVLFRPITRKIEDKATGETRYATIPGMFTTFTVFHSGQVDGYEMPIPSLPELCSTEAEDIDAAYDFVRNVTGFAPVEAADRAFYSTTGDYVGLPKRELFTSGIGAWSTVAHELTHWTGAEKRHNRAIKNLFGTEAYALEELVAEMGAAMILAATGRAAEPRADHANYLANWLTVVKEHPNAIFTAAAAAQKAANLVLETADAAVVEMAAA